MDVEPTITRVEFAAYGGVVTAVSPHLTGTAFVDAMNIRTHRLGEMNSRWVLDAVAFTDGSTADTYDTLSVHAVVARDGNQVLWLDSAGNLKVGAGLQ